MLDELELEHYADRLERNPDWMALRDAIQREHDRLVERLVSPALDTAGESTKDALRGQIRELQSVLSKPGREKMMAEARRA